MDFRTARNLGLIGSILSIVGVVLSRIQWIGFELVLLGVAGFILVLVSLYLFSKIYAEPRIFRYALISSVVLLAGLIIVAIFLYLLIIEGVVFAIEFLGAVARIRAPSEVSTAAILGILLGTILVSSAVSAIAVFFWYRALNTLSRVSGEGLFRLAGLLYVIVVPLVIIGVFIGATGLIASIRAGSTGLANLFDIIMQVGFLFIVYGVMILFASFLVLAIAFYNVKQPQQTPPQPAMPAVPA